MFAGDNQDYLPPGTDGPATGLFLGQSCAYSTSSPNNAQLVYYIAKYIGGNTPSAVLQTCPVFSCPAMLSANPTFQNPNVLIYVAGYGVITQGQTNSSGGVMPWNPFGSAETPVTLPHKLADVSPSIWGGQIPWILTDLDLWTLGGVNPWGTGTLLAPTPPHVDRRSYVFFDGHVEAMRFTGPGLSNPF